MENCVAIISGAPISLAPYIEFYINLLKDSNVNFIILNIESGPKGKLFDNQICFDNSYKKGVLNRFLRLLKGLKFIHENLKNHKCNKIIVAPTRTGMRLFPYLYFFYKKRYILDIRDLTQEDKKIFKYIEDALINNSHLTLISSKGFLRYILNTEEVVNIHNIPFNYKSVDFPGRINKNNIIIGSVGMISYFKENDALIKQLANKPNFNLHFHGITTEEWNINKYLRENEDIKNIHFYGKFDNNDKEKIYRSITIINNIYGVSGMNVRALTANRLYDAAIYKKPIVVSKGTYLSEIVKNYGLGICVDIFLDDIEELIMNFIDNFDREQFNQSCERFLYDVSKEQNIAIKKIQDFINY